ncbi:MAG TPA: hypothetical protein VF915_04075, partial [Reyranella sp.]
NDLDQHRTNRGGVRPGAGRPKGIWGQKAWRDAIIRAAKRRDPVSGRRYLEMAADALVRQATNGDNVALRELGDRLDGRVHGNAGDGQARVSFVVHMPAPMAPDEWQRMAQPVGAASMVPSGEGSPSVDTATSGGIEPQRSSAWSSPAGLPNGSEPGRRVLDVVELAPTNDLGDELGDADGESARFRPDRA